MPSMFVRLWRGISLGGVATTSCQMCWSSRAVGSCWWYWRWRKMVLSNLSCLLRRRRRSWSSFERDMNANALWVALWNSGVSVVVLCPRLTRRRKKARVCLRTSMAADFVSQAMPGTQKRFFLLPFTLFVPQSILMSKKFTYVHSWALPCPNTNHSLMLTIHLGYKLRDILAHHVATTPLMSPSWRNKRCHCLVPGNSRC